MNLPRLSAFKIMNKFLCFTLVFLCFVKCYSNGVPTNFLKNTDSTKQCIHGNVTFGRPVLGQRLVNSTTVNQPGSWYKRNTFKIRYPPYGSKIWTNISQVQIINLYKKCDCYWNETKISSGGIGKSFVEVSVTTGLTCPNHHQILFYNNTRSWH